MIQTGKGIPKVSHQYGRPKDYWLVARRCARRFNRPDLAGRLITWNGGGIGSGSGKSRVARFGASHGRRQSGDFVEATGTTGEPQAAVGAPAGAATASSTSGAPAGAALVVQVPTSGEEDIDDNTLSDTRSVSVTSSTRRDQAAAALAAEIALQDERIKSAELRVQQAHAEMADRPPSSKPSRSARRRPRRSANMSIQSDDLLSPGDVLPPPAIGRPPHGSSSADLGDGAPAGAASQQFGGGILEQQVSRNLDQALTDGLVGDLYGQASRLTEENLRQHEVGQLVADTVSYTHLTLPTIYSV